MTAREKVQISDLIQEVKVLKAHLSKRLVKVEGHLYDDKDTDQEGLIHQVRDLNHKVDSIAADLRFAKWIAGTVSAVVAFIMTMLSKTILDKIF